MKNQTETNKGATVTVQIKVSEARLADVLCNAYEGGSRYWARQEDGKPSPYREDQTRRPAAELGGLELTPDFSVTITDYEADPPAKHLLTMAKLHKGLPAASPIQVEQHTFRLTRKSKLTCEAPAVRAFDYVFNRLAASLPISPTVAVWHEGRCGRCGRLLTVPESVASGFGPVCIDMVAA